MTSHNVREKGVFLYDTPSIENLKYCALFWNNIVVFESYLSEVVDSPDLSGVTLLLLKNGILKFSHTPEGLKNALYDKIYCTLDEEIREYIYHNAEKIVVEPIFPSNVETLVAQSVERDFGDQQLRDLVKEIQYNVIKNKYLDAVHENTRWDFSSLPPEMKKAFLSGAQKLVDIEWKHFKEFSATKHSFEWRNRYLLEQTSVSSSLFVPFEWIPYYRYKFSDYSTRDAHRYLQGLDAIMPIAKKKTIQDFSVKNILEIRQNSKWNNAMNRLGELCSEVSYEKDTKTFRDEVKASVISEYQDALDEAEITTKDLGKELIKGAIYAAISLISYVEPVAGPITYAVSGFFDPVVSYLLKEKKQRNLPLFINNLRKMPLADC